ncbi:hypothetical protein MN116_004954 [Schistosoma mekongi]|uniref:CCAAT-binding factor domain-containing protein n=1 Tax=Schistosoma mekongi TaxID=38744 RepID=A0AAE2D643_SCHME|nr:hypothetical protein MN116_004954 [Schistosoma mekongi]
MPKWFVNKLTEYSGPPLSTENLLRLRSESSSAFERNYGSKLWQNGLPNELGSLNRTTREWLLMALKSRSGQDYMCAMAYLVNSYPMYSIRFLDNLISFISPSKKRDCFRSLVILSHLFCSLIPKNRALISITTRPLDVLDKLDSCSKEVVLCLWHFEDELKHMYLQFIKASEKLLLSDCVANLKRKTLGILGNLVEKQENQTFILSIIINKLGDRNKEFASSVIYKLRLIAGISSDFLHLLVQEVRSFLFRPNLLERSKYYAISLLSCLELRGSFRDISSNTKVSSVASTLIKIYMSFFRSAASSKEIPERLIIMLLSGLCRAAPFTTEEAFTSMLSEVDDLFRLVHTTGFSVSVQALSVLFQISTHCVAIRDRYYQALYRKLLDPAVHRSSKNPTLLRLVYQSMVADNDTDRIAAFVHRILQLCISHTDPGFVVGCLILINKISLSKANLIVISQMNNDQLPVNPIVNLAKFEQSNDDSDEHFSDAQSPDEDNDIDDRSVQNDMLTETIASTKSAMMINDNKSIVTPSSWYHRSLKMHRNTRNLFGFGYNPIAREPKFAQAAGCLLWPLSLLSKHTHPTVNLFANSLLNNSPIQYTGDPFTDFGLMHFLDRFAYKKPKVNKLTQIKPTIGTIQKTVPGKLLQRKESLLSGPRSIAVDSFAFRQLPLASVPVHERFFHNYFKFMESRPGYIKKTEKKKSRDPDEDGSDTDSVPDSEFDDYLSKHERGLFPPNEVWDDDAEPEFSDKDLMDNSADEEDMNEYDFSGMDNVDLSTANSMINKTKKSTDSKRKYHKFDEDENNESDDNQSSEYDDDDEDDVPDEPGQFNLNNLFASAEEVGHLYDVQETGKEKRQRFWEQKRLHSQCSNNYRQRRRERKQNGHLNRKEKLTSHHQSNRRKTKAKNINKSKRSRHV